MAAETADSVAPTTDDDGEVVAAEPPPNDLFANAEVIDPEALPFTATVDTTGATLTTMT